jgi:pre-mRNA-processing factor 39
MSANGHANDDHGLRDKWQTIYSKLEQSPDEFTLWEDLIECLDSPSQPMAKSSPDHIKELLRFSYDRFVERFPLCFGYWIKYAETEFRLGRTENAETVYERAAAAIPYSVEVWAGYGQFKALTCVRDPGVVRELFELAVIHVGHHFLSHPLWDRYIEFEETQSNTENIFRILDRILRVPLHQYARYFERLRTMAADLAVDVLVPPGMLVQFQAEYEIEREDEIYNINNNYPVEHKDAVAEENDLRRRIDMYHVSLYTKTQVNVSRRLRYESAISRYYFHVVFLGDADMINWNSYLDFEEVEGDHKQIMMLYERALIPTALSEELWMRYTRWLMANNYEEEARNVFRRACTLIPAGRVELRLQYARFEEASKNFKGAKLIYDAILESLPGSLDTIRCVTDLLARTSGIPSAVEFVLKQIDIPEQAENVRIELIAKLCRLYSRGDMGIEEARKLFERSIASYAGSYRFWRYYLEFEIDQRDDDDKSRHSRVQTVYNHIRTSGLEPTLIKDLAHIYMVFLLSQNSSEAVKEYMIIDRTVHRPIPI